MSGLLERCAAGSVLIVVIVLLRSALLHRLPRRTFAALWYVALARLLLPVTWPSGLSVYSLLAKPAPAAVLPAQTVSAPAVTVPAALPAAANSAPAAAPPGASVPWWAVVWAVGTVLAAAWFLAGYVRCRRLFAASVPAEGAAAQSWLAGHRLRRRLSLRQSDRVDAPLTYGLLRPVILLPKNAPQDGLAFVLDHELVHIRRFDGLAKLILAAALCLYWWNPAVWLLFCLAGRDLELSCDEAVVRGAGGDVRGEYARVLLSMEARKSGLASALYSHFGGSAMEERIVSIMKYKKATVLSLVLAALLVAGVTVAFATSAEASPTGPHENETPPGKLISVSRGDEDQFTPEQWDDIMDKVDSGEVLLFDTKEEELAYAAGQAEPEPFTYAIRWMQPYTQIVYNDDLTYEVLQGGELTEEDIAGIDYIDPEDMLMESDDARIWAGCKVEYSLHGELQNIYFPVPGKPGEFQLEDPNHEAHRTPEQNINAVETVRSLLMAYETPGYRDETVAEFTARLVPDQDALNVRLADFAMVRNVGRTTPFLDMTVWQTLSEQYSVYMEPGEPFFRAVSLTTHTENGVTAFVDGNLFYEMPDPAALTVGARDDALRSVHTGLQAYLNGLSVEELTGGNVASLLADKGAELAAQASIPELTVTFTLDSLEIVDLYNGAGELETYP